MQVVQWARLTEQQQQDLLQRPAQSQSAELQQQVATIIDAVAAEGDAAVLRYTQTFDCKDLTELRYTTEQMTAQANQLAPEVKQAIDTAYATIYAFHSKQQPQGVTVETAPGVICS